MAPALVKSMPQPLKNINDSDNHRHEKQNNTLPKKAPAAGAEYFEIIARATNDSVRDWNVNTGALSWPRGLEGLLGYKRSVLSEKIAFWFSHIHPEDLDRIQESLREALAGSDERWMAEYRFQRANGEYAHILERALISRDARGAAVRVVGPMMDVTAGKQLQAQARRSQRMEAFGQLAGGVAHDFNNFLTTILGYSDLLLSDTAVKGEVARHITEIRDAAGRASSLTNQLLAFSRRQALEPTVLEVNSVIRNLERSLLGLLGDHVSIVCQLHQLKEGAHIKVDADQFTQIILNLAVNARDAMQKGGRLTIETFALSGAPKTRRACTCADFPPGEYVAIVMADTGIGMSDQVKARLFEPFFTTKDETRNSGLGLATSYGIVQQSGGHICAESEVGQGTTFRIFLPRVAAPPAPKYKKSGRKKLLTGSETVLVLEDEVNVRHISVRVLRELGYEVLEAAHCDGAKLLILEKGRRKIDLLLTDMVMPDMSGRHFADWLRKASPQTKVIFISGYLEESMHPGDRRDPGMCFLPKPFNADQLANKVREVLDEKFEV
jgi:two-component system, cell cycle sensor histidine kinase and response regulator CckA